MKGIRGAKWFRVAGVIAALVIAALTAGRASAQPASEANRHWHQWRGPLANGVAPEGKPPLEWSEDRNIRWKVDIPGQGHSTPIVWGDRIFLQTAIPTEDRPVEGGGPLPVSTYEKPAKFVVLALDRRTGKTAWQRTVREEVPHEGSHRDGSLAPASPITDGRHLYAFFGSRGVYCLTLDGDPVWEKDLGDMQTRRGFGEGSSPALHDGTLIINWDHEGDSFIVALDAKTGEEKWRRSRDEVTSWSTPLILDDGGRTLAVVSAAERVRAYDIKTGDVVWQCGGLGLNCIPNPVAGFGHVIVMSGYQNPAALAIRYAGAKGDLTDTDAITWRADKGTSYVPSPLLYDDTLYFLQKNNGILSCVDPRTGKPYYDQTRLEDITGVYSSPVGADGRVYITGRNGTTVVLDRGPEFKVLATNKLDDEFSASPAIVGKELFLRGHQRLYCVATE